MGYSKKYDFHFTDRKDYKKKYYEKNEESLKDCGRKYYNANKRKIPIKNGMKYSRAYDFWYTDREDYQNKRNHSDSQKKKFHHYTEMKFFKTYGITMEQRDNMILEQDNKCARCGLPFGDENQAQLPAVDHDHSYEDGDPNSVRGIIHGKCNTMIGMHNDSIEELEKSIKYLKKYGKKEEF